MSGRRRVTTVTVVWAAWALCVFGLGCQAQVSYQFVNPFAPKSTELVEGEEEGADSTAVKAAEWAAKPNPDAVKQVSAPVKVAANTALKRVSAEEDGPAVGPRPAPAGGAPAPLAADGSLPPPDGPMPGPEGGCPAVPTEMQKLSHPPYMIEPPDILFIDTIRMIPRPPYVVQ